MWDFGAVYEMYHADTARGAVLGEPGLLESGTYDALFAGEQAETEAIRPGVRAAVDAVRRAGIPDYRRNHCGHGIGIEAYDEPLIAPSNHTVLEPRMVLNIETPYYKLGFGSPVVGDIVLVAEWGVEYLTQMDRELLLL